MIRKGDRVFIKPEWQDPGDADFKWVALTNERDGRVDISPSDIGLVYPPIQTVLVSMLETKERKERDMRERNEEPTKSVLPPQVRGKFFVFDADARPIRVGDILEWVETAGPYGQTKCGRGVVKQEMLVCGCVVTDGGMVDTHWEWHPKDGPEGLYCRHENIDYDHAHKTWARVVLKGHVGSMAE